MTKIIVLDVYGTILATKDADNELPPRKGLEKFFDKCDSKRIKVVSASDALIDNVKIDLKEAFKKHIPKLTIKRFHRFYQLNQLSKDFLGIIGDYEITSEELLVIGDSEKDINGAIKYGACFIQVPEYFDRLDEFDLSKIKKTSATTP